MSNNRHYKMIDKSYEYNEKDAWHRVRIVGFPYFTLSDVKKIYEVLQGNTNGWTAFEQKAKEIAVVKGGVQSGKYYQFTDELALFEIFKNTFPLELTQKRISSWNELMQYIS